MNSVREVGVIQDLVLVPVEQWLAAHPGRESELSDAPYVVLTGHRVHGVESIAGAVNHLARALGFRFRSSATPQCHERSPP